jgi:phytanoyl-CoA hydroxylase
LKPLIRTRWAVGATLISVALYNSPYLAETKKKTGILTDEQVATYIRDGYIVVPDIITKKECMDIAEQIDKMVAQSNVNSKDVLSIIQPHHSNQVIKKYCMHEKISKVLSQIVGAHIPFWNGSVKLFQSMLFIKPPGFPGQAWHQDELYIPTRDRSLTAIWIPIEDVTIENGCLWVIPGSHQQGIMYPTRPHHNNDEYEYEDTCYNFDESRAVPVEMKAGSALFFNGYLLHKSLKNRSNRHRKVLTNHYMTAQTLFPYILKCSCGKTHYVADNDDRNVLIVCGSDPYASKGYDQRNDTHLRVMQNGKVVKIFPNNNSTSE